MIENSNQYHPLACSLYDNLEAFATKKIVCEIIYRTENKNEITTSVIVDLFSSNGAEFLRLENNIVIRLDTLITVNDIEMRNVC